MGDIIYLNEYKKKHDIPLANSPYYALNATEEQMQLAYMRAVELMKDAHLAPYAVLIGYENIKTGKIKLLKELRTYSSRNAFEDMSGINGHYVIAITRKVE